MAIGRRASTRLFQSTLPRGERQHPLIDAICLLDVSIHAPAWGATLGMDCKAYLLTGFNPRSRVGSDILFNALAKKRGVSIHGPAWGGTGGFERWVESLLGSMLAAEAGAAGRVSGRTRPG